MYKDPIVAEIRQAGQVLAEEAGSDLHVFFEHLRDSQMQYKERLIRSPLRSPGETCKK